METTDKISCNILISLLKEHGVSHAVVSPGSRNAPIIVALARCKEIDKTVVIDERSAAFIALGIASISSKPVALICTSGSALLNYAPAIAEAYYRQVPLIVISADRPIEWIDQDDSQTIRQFEALSNYVKNSYNIPTECSSETMKWYINRIVNDALLTATSDRKAPIHINIQLDEPLNKFHEIGNNTERKIELISSLNILSEDVTSVLAKRIKSAQKVLIIAGFMPPCSALNNALLSLAKQNNIAVFTENISNLKGDSFISSIDRILSILSDTEKANITPNIVITIGGALVSRHIKQFLRTNKPQEHWHVGISDTTIDCFTALTKRINVSPADFFTQINSKIISYTYGDSNYSLMLRNYSQKSKELHDRYISGIEWSDLKAFDILFHYIPKKWNLQISNGTSIRYSQLFNTTIYNRIDCNRGVSGIDGCTSTAIGASIAYDGTTLLITGDMSAQYDINALSAEAITSKFKMSVINNNGGGIFRFIKSTSNLPELEEYFITKPKLPLRELAYGYGFNFYDASNPNELEQILPTFMSDNTKPAILRINTPAKKSTKILRNYFNLK